MHLSRPVSCQESGGVTCRLILCLGLLPQHWNPVSKERAQELGSMAARQARSFHSCCLWPKGPSSLGEMGTASVSVLVFWRPARTCPLSCHTLSRRVHLSPHLLLWQGVSWDFLLLLICPCQQFLRSLSALQTLFLFNSCVLHLA